VGTSRRSATVRGLFIGLALAVCLEGWRQYASYAHALSGEGVGASSFIAALVLGFPVNLLTPWLIDVMAAIPGMSPNIDFQYVMLLGVVANWTLLGYLISTLRRPRSE
jgi:hypothetical protein